VMGSKMLEGYYAEGLAALDRGFDARERTSRVPGRLPRCAWLTAEAAVST
jgi:hypothetical protein